MCPVRACIVEVRRGLLWISAGKIAQSRDFPRKNLNLRRHAAGVDDLLVLMTFNA